VLRRWGNGRRGQGPKRDRGQRGLQPALPNFGVQNSPEFAYNANQNSVGTSLSSDNGPEILASMILVGHPARRARELSHGTIVSPRVLSSVYGSFLCRVSSLTLYIYCWLNPHRYALLRNLSGSRTPRRCRGCQCYCSHSWRGKMVR